MQPKHSISPMKPTKQLAGLILFFASFTGAAYAQVFVLGQGGGASIPTCGGTIQDPGGAGSYANNIDVTETFCSDVPGNCIRLIFTEFETEACCDHLIIYSGEGTAGEVIGDFVGTSIPAVITTDANSLGCITLRFTSDGSVIFPGFSCNIECIPCPAAPDIIVLGQGGSPFATCSAIIRDPGGNGNYGSNANVTQTFCSENAGECVQLAFTEFSTQLETDFVRVYNGTGTAGLILGQFSGGNLPPLVTSNTASGGCLTIRFTSNNNTNDLGFKATLNCVSCPEPPIILGTGGASLVTCDDLILDPGGFVNYAPNLNTVQTFCSGTGDCINLVFNQFETEYGGDFVRIYDGNSTSAFMIAEYSGFGFVPPAVTTSTSSGGCMTIAFESSSNTEFGGFNATVSCVPCVAPQAEVIFGENATVNTCVASVLDPGGNGAYAANLSTVQTFCSNSGQCIQFSFDQLDTEEDLDIIRFYDGPTTAAEVLGEASGTTIPPSFTSTTNSGGCLTISFTTNASGYNTGFTGSVSCVECPPPPQNIILGEGGATINTCGGTLLDPGGNLSYADNLNITQTICSGTAQCVTLTFSSFESETALDRLSIYDGTQLSSDAHLGTFSGFPALPVISSSNESGGCLTLVFSSNGSTNFAGFAAVISCAECEDPNTVPTGLCEDAAPFCTDADGGYQYPAATDTQSPFTQPDGSSNVGCLGSTPNPAWYFMKIAEDGDIAINIMGSNNGGVSGTNDIDFILWGPFANQEEICGLATNLTWANDPANIVSCSYSGSAVELATITGAVVGEYYVLLLTNFSNQPTNVYFDADPSSTGQTDCSIFCELDVSLDASPCDSATNTFTVTGEIQLTNPPETGTITIVNSNGGYATYSAPFLETITFSFDTLSSDGAGNDISAFFSADGACAGILTYTAPPSCSSCPVTAGVSGPACIGQNVSLTATDVTNATYSWTGPNGYTSSLQNPVLTNVTQAMAGVYTVTASNAANSCQALASTNVFVFPTPATPSITNSSPICDGEELTFTCETVTDAIYSWTGPNSFTSALQNPVISAASLAADGVYSCTVTVNTCPSLPATTTVDIVPIPPAPAPTSNTPLCDGDDLMLAAENITGAIYEWTNPAAAIFSAVYNPTIANAAPTNSGTYSARVQVDGCWSEAGTTAVVIYSIPATPAPTSNTPVCENSALILGGPPSLPAGGTTYAWTGPNGFSSQIQVSTIANSQQQNEGTYSLIITENGCVSASGTVDVDIVPLPLPNAGPDVTTCSGIPVQIGAPSIPGYAYAWTPVEGLNFATVPDPLMTISNFSAVPVDKMFILTVTEAVCSAKDTVMVTINPQPVANFEGPDPQCFLDNSFDFTAGGIYSANATFDWILGPTATPGTSVLPDPKDVKFNSTGLMNVTLQITDRGCLSNVFQLPVTIHKMPVANFSSDRFIECDPAVINFVNLSESEDPIKTYNWSFGNEKVATVETPVVLYNDPGSFDVRLTIVSEQGCEDTYTIPGMITIHPTPVAEFDLTPPFLDIVSPTTQITDISQGAQTVYYYISDLDTIYQSDPKVTFRDSGHYLITQVVSNEFGCMDSLVKEIIMEYGYKVYVPSAFTPNDDGYNDYFKVYGEDISEISIAIYTRWGQLLYVSYDMENGWDGRTQLDGSVVQGGVYVYKISATNLHGIKTDYDGTVVLLR